MRVIIDRFEGDFAVVELENKTIVNLSRKLVPVEAKEGDVLIIKIDTDETNKRTERIKSLMDDLFE